VEPRLGLALDSSPVAMLLFEPHRDTRGRPADFTCTYVNSEAARILGRERADLECRSVRELLPDGPEGSALLEACGEVLESGGRRQIELEWTVADSGVFSISVAAAGGCVSLWLTDVSEYRHAVSEAVAARAELESITALMPAGVTRLTRDMRYAWANPRFGEWIGRSPKELVGQKIQDVVGPAAFAVLEPQFKRALAGEHVEYEAEVDYGEALGRRWVHASYVPTRNAQGLVDGWVAVVLDVTDKKRLELGLAQVLAGLSELASRLWRARTLQEGLEEILAAVIGLLGADKGNFQLLSDGERRVLTIVAHKGFQQDFLDFFREVSTADDCACGRSLRTGSRVIIEDIEADAGYAPFRAVARAAGYRALVSTPLLGFDGTPLGAISTHFRAVHRPSEEELHRLDLYLRQAADFIQHSRMEQALRRSEQALREADRRKDEFLALIAHELRNPLAPILYSLAALKKTERGAQQQLHAEQVIERQVLHMSRLLDDLLDVSRITRGRLELKRTTVELSGVLDAAVEAARPLLDERHHRLSVELPEEPLRLEGDPVRLAQVFSNLLINAAKYTDPGGQVRLRAARAGAEIAVTVGDNGAGIASEVLPRLFTPFSPGTASGQYPSGGLGLGLSLVRGLVERHGGRVEARSAGVGQGSEFIVHLPLGASDAQAPTVPRPAPQAAPFRRQKVLVVDDNRDAADSCGALLELSGHEVQTAYSAHDGYLLAEAFRPHVLLLDIGLPDVDGYALARRIRAMHWGHDFTLVALTGWGQEADKSRAREAGFDHHLTKPVTFQQLDGLLRSSAGQER
jgi:PAS domain S-box-containing protein